MVTVDAIKNNGKSTSQATYFNNTSRSAKHRELNKKVLLLYLLHWPKNSTHNRFYQYSVSSARILKRKCFNQSSRANSVKYESKENRGEGYSEVYQITKIHLVRPTYSELKKQECPEMYRKRKTSSEFEIVDQVSVA